MNKFENQITTAYLESSQLSILGDFNIDLLVNNTSSKSWLQLAENFQLHQQINKPTRGSLNSATLVDHIFTSLNAKVRAVKVPKLGLSDHYPTCIVMKDGFGTKHCHTSIKYRSFKNFEEKQFLEDLNRCKWSSINENNKIDNNLDIWYDLFVETINKHLPVKTKQAKRVKQPDWITQDILQCMRERDHKKTAGNLTEYKNLRNKCVSLVREAKKTHYQSCIKNCNGDSTKL